MEHPQGEHPQARLQPLVDLPSLAKIFSTVDLSVSPQETEADANHRRWKDKILFLFGLSGFALLFILCLGILGFGSQSPDEKRFG